MDKIRKIFKTLKKIIRYINIAYHCDDDFSAILMKLKIDLISISNKIPEDKELKAVIEHINRYLNIYECRNNKTDIVDFLFNIQPNKEVETLKNWHLDNAFSRLIRVIKREKTNK